ncbi:MAG: aminopeptidase [Lachnospiraceae bacterium]|nr:aminopeptidase [Lachnospiraceae bacterium]
METKNAWESYSAKQLKELETVSGEYIDFISRCKTERECVDRIVEEAEAAGFKELSALIAGNEVIKKGDKVYSVWMNKSVALFNIGSRPLSEGMNILGAHIDSPRLDVKQNPLYEDSGFAYLDTHYYGGVKKYQWVTLPLALHGVIVRKDGTTVIVNIGENEDDPVFFVSDLLIHLAQEQMEKKANKVIEGEALDILIGNKPLIVKGRGGKKDSGKEGEEEKSGVKDKVKNNLLEILKSTYGVEEEDFLSAEIEVVPAGKARETGLDRSMILGYGHDDRVCAYPSLRAILNAGEVERTACCILVDKEEIGSVGATGMKSHFFENMVAEILNLSGDYSEILLKRTLANSCMLSSDVSAGYDPLYASVFDKKNVCYLGHGVVFNKFTGSRGKSGSNDANAEYIAYLRDLLDKDKVFYQTAELGKVDIGGGGTIAYILALYGMNVIDAGVAVLNMHAPWECISKADLYEAYRCYMAFLKGQGL